MAKAPKHVLTLIGVSALIEERAMVEIEATAVNPE